MFRTRRAPPKSYVTPYIVFHTYKIHFQHTTALQQTLLESLESLFQDKLLFKKIDEHQAMLKLKWPHRNGAKNIRVIFTKTSDHKKNAVFAMSFYDKDLFLTLQFSSGKIKIKNAESTSWSKDDIQSLIEHFKELLGIKKPKIKVEINYSPDRLANSFTQSQTHIAHELNQLIKSSGIQVNSYRFNLDWRDESNRVYPLDVTLSQNNTYHTWCIQEKTFLKLFYPFYKIKPPHYYYHLTVSEYDGNELIKLQFTPDVKFGELYTINKGTKEYKHEQKISGNHVLTIYNFFTRIIPVETVMLCDESKLGSLRLRFIHALRTGSTWYESKLPQLRLLDCKRMKTANDSFATQNAKLRQQYLNELRDLPLCQLFKMINAKKQKILMKLYTHVIDNDKNDQELSVINSEMTLSEFTNVIYDSLKKSKGHSDDLETWNSILCDELDSEEDFVPDIDMEEPDAWLKIRINELLWNSLFWIKRRIA